MKGRITALDGLRGLCCIPIVLVHYAAMGNAWGGIDSASLPFSFILQQLYDHGNLFIFPFFWMSGFLMARKYKETIKSMKFFSFLHQRMRTLYPMVFMSITIGILLSIIDRFLTGQIITTPVNLWFVIMNYTLMHRGWAEFFDITPYGSGTWFVCILLLCYIYYYIIVKATADKKKLYLSVITILFFLGWATTSSNIPFIGSGGGYCAFFGGVILYEFIEGDLKIAVTQSKKKLSELVVSIMIIVIAGVLAALGGLSPVSTVMMMVVSPMLVIYALKVKWMKVFLEWKPFQVLGKLSMSIYLSHMQAERIVVLYLKRTGTYDLTDNLVFVVTMLFVAVFAILFYLLVEKRFVPFFDKMVFQRFTIASSEADGSE